MQQIPNVVPGALDIPTAAKLRDPGARQHRPRILILYGSLRPQSFSRKLALEAQRLLEHLGAETRLFDPHELPMLDSVPATHPKVQELGQASLWSEGHVWVSPERHGTLTAVFKNQIDWLPLEEGSVRPTQGRTLAVMQVCGGSQSCNDPAVSAQVSPLKHKPQRVSSCPAPGVGADSCKTGSSRRSPGSRAAGFRSGGDARTAPSAS